MPSTDFVRAEPAPGQSSSTALFHAALVALLAFLTVVDLFATQSILPALAAAYGETPARMGLAVNASTLGMAIASLIVAVFSRSIDRRRGIVLALAALAVPTLLLAAAPNLAAFAALRVAQGLCMATAFTLTLAWLGEHLGPGETAGAFAAYITGNVASNLFGRLVSAAVADHFGLAANFLAFAGLNIAGCVLALFMIKRSTTSSAADPASHRGGLIAHLRTPALTAAFAVGFCILFAFIGTFTYINFVLASPPLGLDMMAIGLVYFVFLPSIATTPLAGHVVRSIGTRPALWSGLAVAGAGLIPLLSGSLAAVMVGLSLVGVGTFFAQAVATGFVGRAALVDRGGASGIYLACYFSGGLVGTAVVGAVFERAGWSGAVGTIGLALIVAAGLGNWFRPPPGAGR